MTKEKVDQILQKARQLLATKQAAQGMLLILEVADTAPEHMDPTLLATVPLFRSVVSHLKKLSSRFEDSWNNDDQGGKIA